MRELSTIIPSKLKLYNQGQQIPMDISGIEDGVFGANDQIRFWAVSLDSPFTTANIYWLCQENEGNGERFVARDGSFKGTENKMDYFIDKIHLEENNLYRQNFPDVADTNGADPDEVENDHWFWQELSSPAVVNIPFRLDHLASIGEEAEIALLLKGWTNNEADPDHHLVVSLNSSKLCDLYWDGQNEYLGHILFPSHLLQNGDNNITIEAKSDTGADTVFLNWVELEYPRLFIAQNNHLIYTLNGKGSYDFNINGFTKNEISVFDITNPSEIIKIENVSIEQDEPFGYIVKFTDAIASVNNNIKRYAVLSQEAEQAPDSLILDQISDLRSSQNGADYIIITHEDFYAHIQPLADYRSSQGLRVKVVDVQDIYDEFFYGIFNPQAIRDFLQYCFQNWTPPVPRYVLLVGDATTDYKNFAKTGRINYLPTYLDVTTDLGQTPHDNWFVCVSGEDVLPDMFLGRIPVRTAGEVKGVVDKIIAYEQQKQQLWHQKLLFVAGNEKEEFKIVSEELAQLFFSNNYFQTLKIFTGEYPNIDLAKEEVKQSISSGSLITAYCGHGNIDRWGSGLFHMSEIEGLTNIDKPTFLVALTCLNGYFPYFEEDRCLAEEMLLVERKGAVACWAPISVGNPTEHKYMAEELFYLILNQKGISLGEATTLARVNSYIQHKISEDLLKTYVLLGDPCTRLKISDEPIIDPQDPGDDQSATETEKSGGGGCFIINILGSLQRLRLR